MTARVLVLDHPDDRHDVGARFRIDASHLQEPAIQVMALPAEDARALADRLGAHGIVASVAPAGAAADLLLSARPAELIPAVHAAAGARIGDLVACAVTRFVSPPAYMLARGRRLSTGRPLIVGILNATPDSFYDGGRYFGLDRSMARADEMLAEGADIIEVGGETARPSIPAISDQEEITRVCPVVAAVRDRWDGPIGIDTYKPPVARAALDAGASIVNDISGLADERMAAEAAAVGAALVITHMKGRPKVANEYAQYERVVDDVYAFLAERMAAAEALGVPRESLIVDPGLSLGKQPAHDLTVVRRLREFRGLGAPIYLAASRKNFIRDLMRLPFAELLEGTMAVVAYGMLAGAKLIRTHDVQAMRRLVEMLQVILGPTPATLDPPTL